MIEDSNAYNEAIEQRKAELKRAVIEQLREMPVVTLVCKKAGISHATFYRWKKEDNEFAASSDTAFREGIAFINDLSESQIIRLIKEGKLPAMSLWLRHNSLRYGAKPLNDIRPSQFCELTTDEEKLFKKALSLINPKRSSIRNARNNKKGS